MSEQRIQEAVENLEKALLENSSGTTVSFEFFMSGDCTHTKIQKRRPDQLKKMNISMRNLRGEFIR